MRIVPAVPARSAAAHPPLTFEASLTYADRLAGHMHLQWPRLARQRRRILTIGLPVLWLVAVLGTVSAWVTADGRRDFGRLMRDLPRFDPLPLAICLAVITAFLLVAWAAFPARMRWQMRTLMGPAGADGPVRVRYGLDREGLTQTLPGLASFVPWALIRGLDEDGERFFVATVIGEEPIAIRKADLAPDTQEGVRLRVRDWAGRAPSSETRPDADPDMLSVGVDLTAVDRAALIARSLTTPAARRARLVGAAGWILGLGLLYPVLLAAFWSVDPYRVPFEAAFPLFVEMIGTDFWQPALGAALFVVLALAGNRLLRGRAVRALADEITAEAPRAAAEARIGEDGIVTLQDGARARMAWSLFGGCERVGDLLILPMRWGSVLPLPLRSFDPEGLARFEALAARHLSGTGGSA